MFSKVLFSIFILLQLTTAHALTVISDLDDTIKITRVKHPDAIKNSLLSTKTFLGMAELMRAFKASPENTLYIVSGSPNLIISRVNELLVNNNISTDGVFLVNDSSKKPEALKRIIENAQDDVVLLGDDQEHDPNFYQSLQTAYPDKVKAI